MQREHPSESVADGTRSTAREFWVRVAIDGTARVIRVVARSPQDALRRFPQDLHRGGRLQYSTADGDLVVEWGNVATLEVGPIIRVVRIVEP